LAYGRIGRRFAVVKVGFIVEGETEKLLIDSASFQSLLKSYQLDCVSEAIDAKGNGNLLPHNIEPFRQILLAKNAELIFILTDQDDDVCITKTRRRIIERENQTICIAIKQIEAWFLADGELLTNLFKKQFSFEFPESENVPFETFRKLMLEHTGRGVSKRAKTKLANIVLNNGFSVQRAATHPNCHSAIYFINKLSPRPPEGASKTPLLGARG
jgi:hypothetical protein